MTEPEPRTEPEIEKGPSGLIIRVAAKGEGATADGRYAALAAPGDVLEADGTLTHGPDHADPPCRHFPACGGCQLQHLSEAALTAYVGNRVVGAALGQGLDPGPDAYVVALPHLSPPGTRRRATLHAQAIGKRVVIGFHEQGSHRVVDMRECLVLAPALAALVAPLRRLLEARSDRSLAVEIALTLADQGPAVDLAGLSMQGLAQTEALLDFARGQGIARLTLDQGDGPETVWEPDPVTITLSGVQVSVPPGTFLQATQDGEDALVAAAREWLAGSATVADLFSGLGTFALGLAGPKTKVLAVEGARDAHLAGQSGARMAGRQVHGLHRDLFRNPLQRDELDRFAAVLLDPPRAGAREQVLLLAESAVPRVVYISCNPASWAKDAVALIAGGYRLAELRPVGQFRWSTHVELASLFVKG